MIPVMEAIAERKKVVSIGHLHHAFVFSHYKFFLFVELNQEQLSVFNALEIREKSV